jgi:hypothetical protein
MFTRSLLKRALLKRSFDKPSVHPGTTQSNTIQADVSNASDVLLQVCCVKGGGGWLVGSELLSER